jgi:hypothetical protein
MTNVSTVVETTATDAIKTVTAKQLMNSLNRNIAARVKYEDDKNAESSNVTSHLLRAFNIYHATLRTKHKETYFESLIEQDFLKSFDFINNSVKANARFNVYAAQKAALKIDNVAQRVLTRATALNNKFCVAAVLTCIQKRNVETFTFDRKHALVMLCSAIQADSVKRSDFAEKFNVTASTASTQVSSSFRVLEALNILSFDDSNKARNVVSSVNYDNAFVKLVEAHFIKSDTVS